MDPRFVALGPDYWTADTYRGEHGKAHWVLGMPVAIFGLYPVDRQPTARVLAVRTAD